MARAGVGRAVGPPRGPGAEETRRALVDAAVAALRDEGFAGASARSIARRAGCNQGLVFYHFGSVVGLLLAALDRVGEVRMARYGEAMARAGSLPELVATARAVFEEDLDAGHMAVLAEMIAGTSSTPGLAAEVAARLAPWRDLTADTVRRALAGTPLATLAPPEELAHAIVALYLGLEMLAHLDGDRRAALTLFDRAGRLAPLLAALAGPPGTGTGTVPATAAPPTRDHEEVPG